MKIYLPDGKHTHAVSWLKLGIASLIAAGVFSLLLVLSRTPGIQDYIPWIDFFHTALVVHVNLSVLIWFMSFSCLFWSLHAAKRFIFLEKIALALSVLGTLILISSPFLGAGDPLINNYIPVLQHPLFFWGVGLFSLGVFIQASRALFVIPQNNDVAKIASYVAAIFTLFSILALFISWKSLSYDLEGLIYFEYLFWGAGHILQFSHTSLLLIAWLLLVNYIGGVLFISVNTLRWLFLLLLLPLLYAVYIYVAYGAYSPEYLSEFTRLMKYGGLTSLPLGLVIAYSIITSKFDKSNEIKAAKAALFSSIILFLSGGIIGFLIHGVNVVIPAHYHGSIVGVTLSFMGVTYYLLPKFGFQKPVWKMAYWQPYVYGGGQLMHILGLAWSGGYGVQRKTAGAAQGLDKLPEIIGMGMMGFGGLISIVGGIMFLIVVLRSMWQKKQ